MHKASDELVYQKVTNTHRTLMRHFVGLDNGNIPYRNHFFADKGHAEWPVLMELVEMGLATKCEASVGGASIKSVVFMLTDAGCKAVGLIGIDVIRK